MAAVDALELAAMQHADAQRRDDPMHAEVTRINLLNQRAAVKRLASLACDGTAELQCLLRGVYEHMLTHHGIRAAVKLRPWLR